MMQNKINGVSMAEPPNTPSHPFAIVPVPSGGGGGSSPLPRGNGIQFLQAIGLLFIGLKLGGIIDWHWLLVLLPLYVKLAVAAVVHIVAIAVAACVGAFVALWFIAKAVFLKIKKRK